MNVLLAGKQQAINACHEVRKVRGSKVALEYAAGFTQGVAEYVAENHGTRAAFDLLAGLSDDVLNASLIGD